MLILGHRGAPKEAPENTIAAFELAMRLGADGVELDVQRSADGVPVVIHDETLDRTCDARGRVDSMSWRSLAGVRAGGEPLPSLERAVEWAGAAGAWLNVEIKAGELEAAVLETLGSADLTSRAIISSFDARIVRRVGLLSAEATRFLLAERWNDDTMRAFAHADAQGLCLHVAAATPTALEWLATEAIPVVVWTVDDPLRLRQLMKAGIHGIITNLPRLARSIAREMDPRPAHPPS